MSMERTSTTRLAKSGSLSFMAVIFTTSPVCGAST